MSRKSSERVVLESIELLHGHDNFMSLRQAMIQVAQQLFEADFVSYSQYDATIGNEFTLTNDESANREANRMSPIYAQVGHTHPVVDIQQEGENVPAMRISDVVGDAEFRERAAYREYMRHLDVQYQLVIPLYTTSKFNTGVTLCNSISDFTQRDCELANLIRPHMIEAFRLVLLQERLQSLLVKKAALLEQSGTGRIDVAFDGQILNETPVARQALVKVFPIRQTTSTALPAPIREWLISRLTPKLDAMQIDQQPPFRWVDADGELSVTLLSVQYELQWASLLVNYSERFDPIKRLHRDGLTRREAEVLFRLTKGETNKQIAKALGMRPDTARTHVERIRDKLHVETRTAAAAIAQAWLQEAST